MLISVPGLSQGRTKLQSRERPENLGLDPKEIVFLEPIAVNAEVTRMGFDVYVDFTVTTKVELSCGRCLEPFEVALNTRNQALYVPAESRGETRTEEGGVILYRDATIDLADRIAEAIRQGLPMKPLCKAECRGLCPHCGQNLNEGECKCGEGDDSFHPFEGLAGKWKRDQEESGD